MKRFYIVHHTDGGYSIQTDKMGCAEMLKVTFDYWNFLEASIACNAANDALKSVGMLKDE